MVCHIHTLHTGFVLSYKRDHGNWQVVQLDADRTSHILQSLHCGATYHAYLTAHNKVGNSRTSTVVTAVTKGGGRFGLRINFATIIASVLTVQCLLLWRYCVMFAESQTTIIAPVARPLFCKQDCP
jgi:hypothetical protein